MFQFQSTFTYMSVDTHNHPLGKTGIIPILTDAEIKLQSQMTYQSSQRLNVGAGTQS